MSDLETAKLYTVSDSLDRPVRELIAGQTEVEIQFNPTSLKVALANTIGENERSGSSRAAQYVDKSSSTLTVELIFDTTDQYGGETAEVRVDVRSKTRPIAEEFMRPVDVGNENVAPKRCLFAWGTFAFVGIMESFDETLDFFSWEGTPLRATVELKLTESRFQFRSEEAQAAQRDTPTLGSGTDEKDWRETAMYNGVESPRLPGEDSLAVPSASATASLKASASLGGGIAGGFSAGLGAGASAGFGAGLSVGGGVGAGVGGSLSAGISGGVNVGAGLQAGVGGGLSGGITTSLDVTPPAFSFGASAALGTSIPGAFSADINSGGGISAGSILSGGVQLHGGAAASASASARTTFSSSASASTTAQASIGFD